MAKAPNTGATQAQSGVEVIIARGTYVTAQGSFGPGKTVTVDAEEAARLQEIGTIKDPAAAEPEEVQDGKLSVTAETGVNVTQD